MILAQGAEATIIKKKNIIIKQRKPKSYRIPQLDNVLRSKRTRAEAKLIEKASPLIPTPTLIESDEITKTLVMTEIKGKKLSLWLDKLLNKKKIAQEIGLSLSKLHQAGIIHGDLTTSNLIVSKKKVYFIDFGLGYHSSRIEDKAVDLHVFREALRAKHPKYANPLWTAFVKGYKSPLVLKQLEKVEARGRYKAQY